MTLKYGFFFLVKNGSHLKISLFATKYFHVSRCICDCEIEELRLIAVKE